MRWALLVAALAAPAPLAAAPLVAPRAGGAVFVGPTSAHVTSILWNPAAAGLMQGFHLLVTGAARLDLTRIDRSTISSADGEPSASGDRSFGSAQELLATPGAFIGVTSDLSSDSLTVGAAVHLLYSEQFPSIEETRYRSDGGGIYGPALTFAVSYRISRSFYAGIGVSILFPKLELRFLRDAALDTCAAPPCGVEDPASAQTWTVETGFDTGFGGSFDPSFGYNGGALLKLGDWWLGFGIDLLFLGDLAKDADVTVTLPGRPPVTVPGQVSYDLPLLAYFGVRRPAFGDFELLVNATYTRLSSHEFFDVRLLADPARGLPEWVVHERGMRDTLAVEAGLEQPPASRVRLGTRVRVETGAVKRTRVAADQVDGLELELAGGLELRLSARLALVASASAILLPPVDANPSDFSPRARIDCNASGDDLSTPACLATREGLGVPSAAGTYFRAGTELTLGFTYDLW